MSLILPIALSLLLTMAAVNTVRNMRRSRSAPYFVLRRAAATRSGRWLLVTLGTLAALIVVVLVKPRLQFPGLPALASSPTVEASQLTLLPASAIPPSAILEPSPTPPATVAIATPTASLSATLLSSESPQPLIATRESDVTPQPGAGVTITAVSTDIDGNFAPVSPSGTLPASVTRIYIFFDFQGMSDGVSWSGVVLINGQLFEQASFDQLWSRGEEGVGFWWFFERNEGWPVGDYLVQFYIGDQLADSVSFQMISATENTAEPTSAP